MGTNQYNTKGKKDVAIVYDFDGTLARGNLQEKTLLPELGLEPKDFWKTVKEKTKEYDADEILVYMHLIIESARSQGKIITKEFFQEHGKAADLFDGLRDESWFSRINEYSCNFGLNVHHYIISSGVKEMIEGCPISKHFEYIFASKYGYDQKGTVSWPMAAINYTNKTQFLFRINKGVLNYWNNEAVNRYLREEARPIPFSRIIFIGDGETDIPCLKMVRHQGGYAIAVYDPSGSQKTISNLLAEDRANFIAPADYRSNTPLDILVRGLLQRIATL